MILEGFKLIFFDLLKTSYKYAMANKIALVLMFVVIIIWVGTVYAFRNSGYGDVLYFLFSLIFVGYGMEVTRDVIKGGKKLPKIRLKNIVISAFKGTIVNGFYMLIVYVIVRILDTFMYFPQMTLDQIFLHPMDLFKEFSGDVNYLIVFVVITCILTYVAMFFSKIAFASVAETGNILDGLNLKRITYIISKIGFKDYVIGYTCILALNLLMFYISDVTNDSMLVFSLAADWFAFVMMFVLEYVSMANLYLKYKQNV